MLYCNNVIFMLYAGASVCMSGYDNRHTFGRPVNTKYFTINKIIEIIKLAINYWFLNTKTKGK